eukprot:CAMPEP_0202915218 /NCGR_PEP_ID=MMETSP1392-20130828/65086_1 /ASSEMBLY_ACC=CAM_ASM_000868 /TAXON_ID=225041 /ORGANISM="Chlamydomonas chlamydogama, Strain SAG 11-48b" /LENGTH=95 /DNA_ID=CAMNT_0049607151 /DNA_START=53 /DNA_END=336 /DNA_ORIENTATION=-
MSTPNWKNLLTTPTRLRFNSKHSNDVNLPSQDAEPGASTSERPQTKLTAKSSVVSRTWTRLPGGTVIKGGQGPRALHEQPPINTQKASTSNSTHG